MAKKKKKRKAPGKQRQPQSAFAIREEVEEEIIALAAIYGEEFQLDEDNHGFRVKIVPHPGDAEANYVELQLHIRCAPSAA
jgi:translation initiation factor 2-alpha kinase 4